MREKGNVFMEFALENDMDFYEKYLINLTEEELEKFMEENPDFLEK